LGSRRYQAEEVEWLLDRYILPKLGTRNMVYLAAADIARVVHGLSITPALANRVRALLSKMLSLAVVWGVRSDAANPARAVQRYPERSARGTCPAKRSNDWAMPFFAAQRSKSEPWQAIAANETYRVSQTQMGISSGYENSDIYFTKCITDSTVSQFACFKITYRKQDKKDFEVVVTSMSNSLMWQTNATRPCVYRKSDSASTQRTEGVRSRPDDRSAQAVACRSGFAL